MDWPSRKGNRSYSWPGIRNRFVLSDVLAGAFGDDKHTARDLNSFGQVYPQPKATKINPLGLSITCVLVPANPSEESPGRK